jgi:alkylation response protein AidB-like acyl-CoA dehydrogenase
LSGLGKGQKMPLYHNEDQLMLKDSVSPFLAEKAPVSHLRSLRDRRDERGFSESLWGEFKEMGLTGMLVPDAHGGLGMGHMEAGIVLEEIGRNLTPSPFLTTSVGAVAALSAAGGTQADRWLPAIAAGEAILALAVDEKARHRPDHVATKAVRSGNGFRLDGQKSFVLHGYVANALIVSAQADEGLTLFLVPQGSAGLSADPRLLVDSSLASIVTLNGVEVDSDAVLGDVGGGEAVLKALLSATRTGAAAEMVGVGQGAMDMTVGYLKERKQFGRLIGEFQALQHRAAHLYGEMEVARATVMKAQQLLDEGSDAAELYVSVAKAKAGRAANLAVREAVQMHGGIGMTDEFDVGLYMKRDRALSEFMGDAAYHADRVARLNGY